ncbi:MAG: branched-chain amino acid ABC transporter permease [Gammaproteobacteria bacterium]
MVELLQFLIAGLVIGSLYGLIGIGFTTVYNVTGIVNFAQGDFAMLGAMIAIAFLAAGIPTIPAAVMAVVIVAILGAVIERWMIRPVGQNVIRGIIVTIGVGIMLQGSAVVLWGAEPLAMPAFSGETPIHLFGATIPPQAIWVFTIALALMIGLNLFFRRTYLGKAFRACAVNPFAARLMGIRVATMNRVGFVLSGLFGAIAGIIIAPITLTEFDTGITVGIKGFVAGIIGGFGHPIGAAIGGLVLGVLEAMAAGYLSSGYKNAIAFVVLLIFLFLRPTGIMGEFEKVEH